MTARALLALAGVLLPIAAAAQPTPRDVVDHALRGEPLAEAPAVADPASGLAFQSAYVELLTGELGRPVGFKAALTTPAAQARFGVTEPVLGVLLDHMILPDGSTLPARFAARPVAEGDLLVRVRDASINSAATDLELLAGLDAVIPFLELADLLLATNVAPTGPLLTAINAGARAGVRGAPIPLETSAEQLERLAAVQVVLTDERGATLGEGSAAALLGHPIHAVRWIRDELLRRDEKLRKGDLLSLGSLTPLVPIEGQARITATYRGLRDDQHVAVSASFGAAAP